METALLTSALIILIVIYGTDDLSLLTNTGTSPLPVINVILPPLYFAWVAPLIPTGLFIWIHFHLLEYWRTLSDLPGVFADGILLSRKGTAWLGSSWVHQYLPVLRKYYSLRPSPSAYVLMALLYLGTPIVIFLVGWKCCILHDFLDVVPNISCISICIIVGQIFAFYTRKNLSAR